MNDYRNGYAAGYHDGRARGILLGWIAALVFVLWVMLGLSVL